MAAGDTFSRLDDGVWDIECFEDCGDGEGFAGGGGAVDYNCWGVGDIRLESVSR